jgi:hypothetical protein
MKQGEIALKLVVLWGKQLDRLLPPQPNRMMHDP